LRARLKGHASLQAGDARAAVRFKQPEKGREPRISLIWPDIGNYHAARSWAVTKLTPFAVDTIEILGQSSYEEFRAGPGQAQAFSCYRLGLMPPLIAAKARSAIHNLLTQLSPDAVFVPGWSMLEALLAIEWCTAHDVPFVIMSDSKRNDAPRNRVKEAIKRRLAGLAGAALVAGAAHAEYAAELGIPRSRIFYGYDVVDNEYFAARAAFARRHDAALRAKLNLPLRYLLSCGRLIERKNIRSLIEGFALYRAASGDESLHLVIAGPGLLPDFEGPVPAHALQEAVHLVGPKDYCELPLYYGLAEAFVLPSKADQWGLVVNEAMAAGLPVLVSERCGCAPHLVEEGRNGFVFDPFDVQAIADSIKRLCSDGAGLQAMGAASQIIIRDWGLERFAYGFEAAARAALAAPKRRARAFDRGLLRMLAVR
jgi:glycosyltransferase involved in cell wall biosynthesis